MHLVLCYSWSDLVTMHASPAPKSYKHKYMLHLWLQDSKLVPANA